MADGARNLFAVVACASGECDPSEVLHEAADVANFALMVADVCGALPEPEASTAQDTDTVTPDEAQRLLSESETCSLLPWEIEDDGDDYVISSPGAHAEIARVHHGQGADIDAAWIVRAVNTLPRLARTVVAQGEDNARLRGEVASLRVSAEFYGTTHKAIAKAMRHDGKDSLAGLARERQATIDAIARVLGVDPDAAKLLDAVARLREIIDGRTTPPTDEEIAVHAAQGGFVTYTEIDLATGRAWTPRVTDNPGLAQCWSRYTVDPARRAQRWRFLDREGKPCPWPAVEGGE